MHGHNGITMKKRHLQGLFCMNKLRIQKNTAMHCCNAHYLQHQCDMHAVDIILQTKGSETIKCVPLYQTLMVLEYNCMLNFCQLHHIRKFHEHFNSSGTDDFPLYLHVRITNTQKWLEGFSSCFTCLTILQTYCTCMLISLFENY